MRRTSKSKVTAAGQALWRGHPVHKAASFLKRIAEQDKK